METEKMKNLISLLALFLVVGLTAQFGFAQNGNKSDEKEMLIKAAHFLEEKPFDKDAKNVRGWAVKWASDTNDVTVIVCGGTAAPIMDKKSKFGSELLAQYLIAMTAFKLQNPINTDENAAQTAGLESVLKTYETMLKENPKAKAAGLEELLAKRNNNELAKFVAAADCGKK